MERLFYASRPIFSYIIYLLPPAKISKKHFVPEKKTLRPKSTDDPPSDPPRQSGPLPRPLFQHHLCPPVLPPTPVLLNHCSSQQAAPPVNTRAQEYTKRCSLGEETQLKNKEHMILCYQKIRAPFSRSCALTIQLVGIFLGETSPKKHG